MSKFCGVCHFDSRPTSAQDETRVRAALGLPGYTAPEEHRQPGLLMGWAAGSDAASGRGRLESSGRLTCLWDGRIDNPKDLLRQTGLGADSPDSAIILSLYRQKGVEGLRAVVGDWSLCLWDAKRREIVLASDYAGIRPLYYHRGANSLYWSSSLADLVLWTGITELDDTFVGRFLVRGSAAALTPYANIFAVPAGQAVSIDRERIVKRAFWNLPTHWEVRYRDERQYEEQLLELFRESVQARIATGTPVCAELSGGLDSSSVVCMADSLRREMPGLAPELTTFSYTHENCPDEKYFREVERFCQLSGSHLELRACPAVTALHAGATPAWWEPRFQELARRMAATGSGVLLTGQLGDLIMGNSYDDPSQVTEWLAKGHPGKAGREAYAWGRAMQAPIYPILWRSVREAFFSWVPAVGSRAAVGAIQGSTEDSLAAGFRARMEFGEQERHGDSRWRHIPPGRRRRFRSVGETLEARALQTPEALQHLSYAHPFAHRPLVEFMLTIPARVVFGPGQPRRLMRRAFAGLLPPLVLGRKSKAAYTSMYRMALMPLAAALLKRPAGIQLVERGYIDGRSLARRLEKFTQGLDCNENQLRVLLLLEFWLRNRMAPRHAPAPAPEVTVS